MLCRPDIIFVVVFSSRLIKIESVYLHPNVISVLKLQLGLRVVLSRIKMICLLRITQ